MRPIDPVDYPRRMPTVADPSRPDHVIWWDELQKYGIWLLK